MPRFNRLGHREDEYTYWHCSSCTSYACNDEAHDHYLVRCKHRVRFTNVWDEAMKRPDAAKVVEGAKGLVKDEHAAKNYPNLVAFLCDDTWDDGGTRTPGSLTFYIEDGVWKACLNDRDASASLYVTGDNAVACMKSLESRLNGATTADWRSWKKKGKGR